MTAKWVKGMDGVWRVKVDDNIAPGSVVVVVKRDGKHEEVTLGAQHGTAVDTQGFTWFIYEVVAKPRRGRRGYRPRVPAPPPTGGNWGPIPAPPGMPGRYDGNRAPEEAPEAPKGEDPREKASPVCGVCGQDVDGKMHFLAVDEEGDVVDTFCAECFRSGKGGC